MAVAALLSNAIPIVPVGVLSGGLGSVPMLQGREAASQSFVRGTPLTLVAGLLTTGGEDVVADIVGVAAEDASGTTNNPLLYWPAGVDTIWEGTLEDQATVGHALVQANIGTDYGVKKDDNELYYIDENETTAVCLTTLVPRDDEDITNAAVRARVQFRFLAAALDTTVSA